MNELLDKNAKNWLQRLKEESWEAELLISTVAIFSALQLFELIDWATNIAIDMLPPSQYLIGYGIVFGGLLAISILATMFILHFLLRAYWVGLVGLNSVFPDYSIENSAYSEIFTKKILSILPKLKKTIQDVDELSSVIFSAAFFMLFIYTYLSLIACLCLLTFNYLSEFIPAYILFLPMIIASGVFIFQSVLTVIANFKKFKKNEKVQLWYFKAVKWGSILMLGPLYKYLLQISMTFGSNYKKKKSLIGLTIVFITIGFMITLFQFSNSKIPYLINQDYLFDHTRIYNGYYASRMDEPDFLIAPQIDSDIVSAKIMRLFIPIYNYERGMHKKLCGQLEEKNEIRDWYLNCYTAYHQISINGENVIGNFMKYELPETQQFGIISYINLENLEHGNNKIKIIKKLENAIEWEIPFQYSPTN